MILYIIIHGIIWISTKYIHQYSIQNYSIPQTNFIQKGFRNVLRVDDSTPCLLCKYYLKKNCLVEIIVNMLFDFKAMLKY